MDPFVRTEPARHTRSPNPAIERIATEHRQLDLRLEQLGVLLEDPQAFQHKRWGEALLTWLDWVVPFLRMHFLHEEDSPLYNAFIRDFPRFSTRLEQLRTEHGELAEEAAHIRALARSNVTPELAHPLDQWLHRLRKHDAAEREILQRAYYEDIGNLD